MIAGPDLAKTTIQPNILLDFVSGHLGRQFVSDKHDLEQKVALVNKGSHHDGRYRVNELFCHSDTWQMTVERLALTSDAVLMDLRSFSFTNRGCIFELRRLFDSVSLNRIVFLIDSATDRVFLKFTLEDLWQTTSADSPNQTTDSPTIRFFRIERQSEGEVKALLWFLLATPATGVSLSATRVA